MKLLNDLFTNNREWAERIKAEDPNFFATLSAQQAPNTSGLVVPTAGSPPTS